MRYLSTKQIQEIIPHRHPFLLVDYIEDYEPGVFATGYKCVTYREDFFCWTFSSGTGYAGCADGGGVGAGWRSCNSCKRRESWKKLHISEEFRSANLKERLYPEIR